MNYKQYAPSLKKIVMALLVLAALGLIFKRVSNFEDATIKIEHKQMEDPEESEDDLEDEEAPSVQVEQKAEAPQELGAYGGDSDHLSLSNEKDAHIPLGKCGGATQFMSSNLLPKNDPAQGDFAEFAPSLDGKNFVDAYKYVFGSQSQSLRNANRQLRSDPANPQEVVCPWMQSTITPEERRQLEIGAGH